MTLQRSQTDIDTKKNNEDEDATFETIAPEKDNAVNRNSKLGSLAVRNLKKMN